MEMVRKNWRESLLLVVGCITLFQLVLVRLESLRILVQSKDLNMFFTAVKIHTMARIVKKQNNFIFSSVVNT